MSDLDNEELLVTRAMYRDKEFIKKYIANPEEELKKLKERNKSLSEYVKANVSNSKEVLRIKSKTNKDYNQDVILLKLLNSLKHEASELQGNDLPQEDILQRADVILNMSKIIESYKDLQPTLRKFFTEKAKKEKEEQCR